MLKPDQLFADAISRLPVLVLKIINPAAGFTIAFLCAVVILGGNNPFVVDCTSSRAEASGLLVPIPTFWENEIPVLLIRKHIISTVFFILPCFSFLINPVTTEFATYNWLWSYIG